MKVLSRVLQLAVAASLAIAAPVGADGNKSVRVDAGEPVREASTVNGSVTVADGAEVTGEASTVNGTVRIGDRARVALASTVNGSLRIGDEVELGEVSSVNGSIRIGEGSKIDDEVTAVNGSIRLQRGTTVGNGVSNVNGSIELSNSTIGGDIETVNGPVYVIDESRVGGDIIVRKPGRSSGWSDNRKLPKVVVGPGSVVEGVIELEQEVELYISNSARVGGVRGVMSMDDAVRFDGDSP